jgi:hypothetical protein
VLVTDRIADRIAERNDRTAAESSTEHIECRTGRERAEL